MKIGNNTNIYLWRTDKAIKSIVAQSISAYEATLYLVIYQVITTLLIFNALTGYVKADVWFYYDLLMTVIIIILGTYRCYLSNGGSKGENIIRNFIVLSVPLTIKITILFYFFVYLQYQILLYAEIYTTPELGKIITVLQNIIVQVIFFWRMIVNIGKSHNN